jgi:hypothetical protein
MSSARFVRINNIDPRLSKEIEKKHQERAFFPMTGSVVIFGGAPIVENEVQKQEKLLQDYNKKLCEHSGLFIRPRQTVRTHTQKYFYIGRYVYIRGHNLETLQSSRSKATDSDTLIVKTAKKGKKALKTLPEAEEIEEEKDDWIYVGTVDEVLRAPDFAQVFKDIGSPPISVLDGVKYGIVIDRGEITDHVILPYSIYIRTHINHLFNRHTILKLA